MQHQERYVPDGTVQGDSHGMPNRGTSTGMNGDTYGADLSQSGTNRMKGIRQDAKSDPHGQKVPEQTPGGSQ